MASSGPKDWLWSAEMTRREFMTRLAMLGAAVPAAGALAAVGRPARVVGAQEGGTLTYGFWQPIDTLDPQVMGLQVSASINQGIQDRLVWKKPGDATYYPGLATSWESTPDFTSYTFTLRNDVTFHDGTPFNAEAVKFTFDRIVDPATTAGGSTVALGPYAGSEVVDDYTITVTFSAPNGAFLNMLTTVWLAPQSPTAVQQYGPDYQDHLAGTGPFMLSEYVHNDHVTLVRNPDYTWGPAIFKHTGPAVLETLVYRLLPEDATRVAALKSGEIDLIDRVAPRDLADFQSNDDYKTLIGQTGGMPWFMPLNTQKAPTDDPAVRQAMMMTFDQAAVVDLLFKGTLEPAYSLLEPTVIGFSEDHKALITHDPEGAKALLEEAGWTEGSDGIREKDGQPLKVINLIVANFGMDEMSVAIQSQLREVGIDMEIRSAEAAATFAALDAGEHNCTWAFYWWADPSGGLELFFRGDRIGSGNASFLASPELDKLLADGRATGDDQQRAALYSQAVSLILENHAALPAFSKRLVLASKATVDMESVQTNVEGYPNFYDVGFVS